MRSLAFGFCLLGMASGCYMRPYTVQNPKPTSEGVAVSLVGEDCEDHRAVKGDPVTRDMSVKVRVDNPTDRPLRIGEHAIKLLVDERSHAVRFPEVVEVGPHGSRTLVLDFTHYSLCQRESPFQVAWNDALQLGDHPLAVENLSFRP